MSTKVVLHEVDVLAMAQRAMSGRRGITGLSMIEIRAMAQFVIWAKQQLPETEKEKENE